MMCCQQQPAWLLKAERDLVRHVLTGVAWCIAIVNVVIPAIVMIVIIPAITMTVRIVVVGRGRWGVGAVLLAWQPWRLA
jgi:hypothetical protein